MKQYSASIDIIVEAESEEEAKQLIIDGNASIMETDIDLMQIGDDADVEDEENEDEDA